jgi:hypothetical protein
MNMKKLATIAGLGLLLTSGATFAATQSWFFQDDDIDFMLDSNLNLIAPTSGGGSGGTISVGDSLVSVFELPTFTINGTNAIPTGQELTGIAAITLLSKDGNGDLTEGDWVFGAVTGGLNAVLTSILGTDAALAGQGGDGSVIGMWLNGTSGAGGDINLNLDAAALPASNCTSIADCMTQGSLGNLLQVDGFLGDPDEFWTASVIAGGDNIDTVANLGIGTQVTTANFGLSTFYNTVEPVAFHDVFDNICVGATIADSDQCVNIRGFSTIVGGRGLTNGAFAHSDANATKFVEVPEPSILMLLSVGLLGIGTGLMKRKV